MTEIPDEQNRRTDRHRPRRATWAIVLVLAAVAVVINMAVIDGSQIGFLIPVFAAVAIAVAADGPRTGCGRRHAK